MGEGRREITEAERAYAAKRNRRRLGCVGFAIVLGLLLPEVLVRWMLFGSSELAESYGAELRDPGLYADPLLDTEYWTLRHALGMDLIAQSAENHHPELGWRPRMLDAETLRHRDEEHLDGRRPILLYGASYASCVTPHIECFQGLLEASNLSDEYCLLNYGCGGYGIDQVYLLMRATLDLYADLDPIVVVLPVLDSDFERSSLDFRSLPKPRLELVDGELRHMGPVPSGGADAYLRERGIGITSYAWAYLTHAETQLPGTWRNWLQDREARLDEQFELIEAILDGIEEELVQRDFDHVYLLATSPRGLPPKPIPRMEARVTERMRDLGLPFLLLRPYVADALEHLDGDMSLVFLPEGTGKHHPTPLGNRVLFEALKDGLDGRYWNAVSDE